MKIRISPTQSIHIDWFIVLYFAFKFFCDMAFWVLLPKQAYGDFTFDFNLVKWVVGFVWCSILFFSIKHDKKLASSFFLYLVLTVQIVPLSTVYALSNESSVFFNLTCLSFLFTIGIVNNVKLPVKFSFNKIVSYGVIAILVLICLYVLFLSYQKRGLPGLTNLNLYDIYKFRREHEAIGGLLLPVMMQVALPIGMTLSIKKKRYSFTVLFTLIGIAMFLYTGHKTFLFGLPLVLICAAFADKTGFYKRIFNVAIIFFIIGVLAAIVNLMSGADLTGIGARSISNWIFGFIIRREFFIPANLKFCYYDYFSIYEKLGLYGIFPRFLVEFPSRYSEVSFPLDIAAKYFGKPFMYSNTGYLVEGYMRFGYFGIFLEAFLFGRILQLMDRFQEKTGYGITIGFFIYAVFSLNDGVLIGNLFFGTWAFIMFILVFYKNRVSDS